MDEDGYTGNSETDGEYEDDDFTEGAPTTPGPQKTTNPESKEDPRTDLKVNVETDSSADQKEVQFTLSSSDDDYDDEEGSPVKPSTGAESEYTNPSSAGTGSDEDYQNDEDQLMARVERIVSTKPSHETTEPKANHPSEPGHVAFETGDPTATRTPDEAEKQTQPSSAPQGRESQGGGGVPEKVETDADLMKERDYLRKKLNGFEKNKKEEIAKAVEAASSFAESERLVKLGEEKLKVEREKAALNLLYEELEHDVNKTRAVLLNDLKEDLERGVDNKEGEGAGASIWSKSAKAERAEEHIGKVRVAHAEMIKDAKDKYKGNLGHKTRDNYGGKRSSWGAVNEKNYQFMPISELVRLRIDKAERAAARDIRTMELKMSAATRNATTRLNTQGSLLKSTMRKPSTLTVTTVGDEADGEGGEPEVAMGDAAATVRRLEQELHDLQTRNSKLEAKLSNAEQALNEAYEEKNDLEGLKARQAALVDRQRQEKENRSRAEAATKQAIKKVVLLSQHVEKLMLHLKHEAVSKAKAQEAAGRAAQEVSLIRTRNKALNKRAASKDVMIRELSEGAKILEDQLRLMDEKYMDIRAKLDFTRTTSTRDVAKYKQEASMLRAKWIQYSQSTTMLDDVGEMETMSQEKNDTAVLRSKKSKVRPKTQILPQTKLVGDPRSTSSMPALS